MRRARKRKARHPPAVTRRIDAHLERAWPRWTSVRELCWSTALEPEPVYAHLHRLELEEAVEHSWRRAPRETQWRLKLGEDERILRALAGLASGA